jgi:hypothetical protein
MPVNRVRMLVAAIADGVTASPEQVHGLTEDELREVEQDQAAPFGAAYRCFLELAGRGAGHFFEGSDMFYPLVLGLGTGARELLEENRVRFVLADTDRVILMHQGYHFDFLRGTGDDPEVWSYDECSIPEPTLTSPRFTDWLEVQVRARTEWRRRFSGQ